jgi:hypothetical protein
MQQPYANSELSPGGRVKIGRNSGPDFPARRQSRTMRTAGGLLETIDK